MKRSFLCTISILTFLLPYAQTGRIVLSGTFPEERITSVRAVLLKNDSMIVSGTSGNPYHIVFDSLAAGIYALKIYGGEEPKKWYENIIVTEGATMNMASSAGTTVAVPGGALIFTASEGSYDLSGVYTFNLSLNDTLIASKRYTRDGVAFGDLKDGNYRLEILYNGKLQSVYHDLIVANAGDKMIDVPLYGGARKEPDDSTTTEAVLCPTILYGNPQMSGDKSSPVAGNIKVGFMQNFFFGESKYVHPGFAFGMSLDAASFNREWDTTILPGRTRENYIGGNLTYGFVVKFTAYDFTKVAPFLDFTHHTLFLDLGVEYNLPILFHHVAAKGTTTVNNRFIHQFTNFSATVRLGYKAFAFTAEYRLSDYVLGKYPELPRLKAGICFMIYQ